MKHTAEFKPRPRNWTVGTKLVEDDLIYGGKIYRGADQVGKLCRELKTGTLEIYRGDMLCGVVDVENRAKKSLRENDRGFSYVSHVPFSASGHPDNGGSLGECAPYPQEKNKNECGG